MEEDNALLRDSLEAALEAKVFFSSNICMLSLNICPAVT